MGGYVSTIYLSTVDIRKFLSSTSGRARSKFYAGDKNFADPLIVCPGEARERFYAFFLL